MAKRARGTVRPGQRRPAQRSARPSSGASRPAPATGPTAAPASVVPDGLTDDEEAQAAALEARIVAQEPAAQGTRSRRRQPAPNQLAANGGSSLSVRYAHEYDYVTRDLRRIFALMGLLLGLLFAIWIVLVLVLKA